MTEKLLNTIGQNLVAVGLYTVAFESMVLTFRAQMHGYLSKYDPSRLQEFEKKACKTADQTLQFCEPTLVQAGILDQAEIAALTILRRRRNKMAHEGYNEMFTLTVKDIEDDVTLMFKASRKVEQWRQAIREPNPDGSVPFSVSPSIFRLYLSVAQELACTKLSVETGGADDT
ncbi:MULTISPECIES: hypothetical protein [Burkholderia cepacia complex]|uniref:hypothetical protein n=1 Tax=Burkholderia cepacia complex TaxID=87882 RepID=UPI000942BF6A|nr:hypothetical protein [Burkholderia cenocepacia]MBR8507397.1 hypothetical protein [Burkholderia cenocepacia]RQV63347.1 hypothetical protein DF020_00620 [Burkholderia cenocepacia]